MNEISPVYDLATIAFALVMGMLLCVLYEIFKAVRLSFPIGSVAIFVLDILFWVISAVVTFCLLLVRCRGYVRWFVLASETVGFVIWRILLGERMLKVAVAILKAIKSVISFVSKRIIMPITARISTILRKVLGSLLSIMGKCAINLKKVLQQRCKLLYNWIDIKCKRRGFVSGTGKRTKGSSTTNASKTKQTSRKKEKAKKQRYV